MKVEELFLHNGHVCLRQQSKLGFDIFWMLCSIGWVAYAEREWPSAGEEDPGGVSYLSALSVSLYKTRSFKFPQSSDFREAEACLIRTAVADYIDRMVHDLKSKEASDINNRGRDAQIEYLLGSMAKGE